MLQRPGGRLHHPAAPQQALDGGRHRQHHGGTHRSVILSTFGISTNGKKGQNKVSCGVELPDETMKRM